MQSVPVVRLVEMDTVALDYYARGVCVAESVHREHVVFEECAAIAALFLGFLDGFNALLLRWVEMELELEKAW